MKRNLYTFVAAILVLLNLPSKAQVLFEENFDYPAGDSLRGHGWNITGTSTVNTVLVTASSLTYSGYPSSGIGNGCTLTNTGQDVHDTLSAPVTSGTVYASILVRVTAAQVGDYFFHLTRTTAPTTDFYGRTFIRLANNGSIAFGIQKGAASATNPVAYTDSIYTLNTTYLLVIKYVFNTGSTTDDQVSLFVFTDPTLPSSEPAPTVGPVTSTVTDVAEIGLVALRQGTAANAPSLIVDGIRVGLTWNDAPLPVQLASFTGQYNQASRCVEVHFTTVSETRNYGFVLQRSPVGVFGFENVSDFIAGHGTTNIPHEYTANDCSVQSGTWQYRLAQYDLDGSVHYSEAIVISVYTSTSVALSTTPIGFELQQNFPNPFNPSTEIRFSVAQTGQAVLEVYNVLGQKVAVLFNGIAEAGRYHNVQFSASNFPSGLYTYRLASGTRTAVKKMILLR